MCIRDRVCNEHLPLHNQVDHRSYEKQGKLQIPAIHECADARKIEQKFLAGQEIKGSWKEAENQIIKQQNTLLQKILDTFGKVSGALSLWKERLNDIRDVYKRQLLVSSKASARPPQPTYFDKTSCSSFVAGLFSDSIVSSVRMASTFR